MDRFWGDQRRCRGRADHLSNSKGISAEIIPDGAILKEHQAPDRNGKFTDLRLTADDLQKFERFRSKPDVDLPSLVFTPRPPHPANTSRIRKKAFSRDDVQCPHPVTRAKTA